MDRSAYIVVNKQQEYDVLNKLEKTGVIWNDERKPTEYIPSYSAIIGFPYVIYSYEDGTLTHDGLSHINDKREIVYDGRKKERPISVDSFEKSINKKELIDILNGFDLIKEKNMSDKYVVSQEFMNDLKEWKNNLVTYNEGRFIGSDELDDLPGIINAWWGDEVPDEENNNRLIAILRWVNGEDVFEVKSKKWVVRSKESQGSVDGEPLYIWFVDELTLETETEATMPPYIRRFNTKEEAESWANSHQEVIEVEE